MFFWQMNNEFANILQKGRAFCPIVFQWEFIRGWYFSEKCLNQRTNGPVNAHLISGPSISTKHTKPGKNKVKK